MQKGLLHFILQQTLLIVLYATNFVLNGVSSIIFYSICFSFHFVLNREQCNPFSQLLRNCQSCFRYAHMPPA